MITILLKIVSLVLLSSKVSPLCSEPQKVIYLSLNTLSNQQNLQKLFTNISSDTTIYNLTYRDSHSSRSYALSSITYQLSYNHHYQRETYLDERAISVSLGIINLYCRFDYQIRDSQQAILYEGVGYARSYLDPAKIEKELVERDGIVEWEARVIQLLHFTALWTCEAVIGLPPNELLMIQKMLNNIVPVTDIRTDIQTEINVIYRARLKTFLNSQQIFSTKLISYDYRNITMPLAHKVFNISIRPQSSGLVALISFGADDAEQKECGSVPSTFNESLYGGLVEMFSMKTIKFIVVEALRRGLFEVKLDQSWQSDVFQLTIGDLGNAVPFADGFNAAQSISIQCSLLNISKVTVASFDEETIYLQVPQKCIVQVKGKDVLSVSMQLITLARIKAQANALSVRLTQVYSRKNNYQSIDPAFIVGRGEVAEMIVQSLLNRLTVGKTFGSQIPLLSRKFPAVQLTPDHLIVLDASEFYTQGQRSLTRRQKR